MQDILKNMFKKIYGHDKQKKIIVHQLVSNKFPQTCLLVGKQGIGKTSFARIIAEAIFYRSNPDDYFKYNVSSRIGRFDYPDFHLVFPASGQSDKFKKKTENTFFKEYLIENSSHHPFPKSEISLTQIKNLQTKLDAKPFEASVKVVLLIDVHRMNEESSNAFLKTLEEPPGETFFLMTSSYPEKIISTIKSRSVIIGLNPIGKQELIESLIAKGFDNEVARFLSVYSQGSFGKAISASYDELIKMRRLLLKIIYGLVSNNISYFWTVMEEFAPMQSFYKEEDNRSYTAVSLLTFLLNDIIKVSISDFDNCLNIDLRSVYMQLKPADYKDLSDLLYELNSRFNYFTQIPLAPHPFWSSIFLSNASRLKNFFSQAKLKDYLEATR